jgi:hypothetical protein
LTSSQGFDRFGLWQQTILAEQLLTSTRQLLCQTDWMAVNKSKRWDALTLHVSIYSLGFIWLGWQFAAITFATHFVTDALTSRATRRLYYPVFHRHWFFAMIGLDQLIHYVTLAATYNYLFL